VTGMGELNSLQAPMVKALVGAGWVHVPGDQLARSTEQPFIEDDVADALVRLNPRIAEDPRRVDEILPKLRTVTLGARADGLVETNRMFASWLRGFEDHEYIGTNGSVPVRLIDFDDLANNRFVVSEEVTFGVAGDHVRFDLVLWVNGFPLAVGELKTPTSVKKSWLDGANDIVETYQPDHPEFFVPNVACFASEGKEFMYAAVGAPVERWSPWGPSTDSPKLADVLAAAVDMLKPSTLLDLLADFTLYEAAKSNDTGSRLTKIIARYTQYEAVNLICDRAVDPDRQRGLIYHTQGSGKTLAMVFAAGKMLRDPRLSNPTIVLIADRVQLVRQTWEQFRTTSMPRLLVPDTARELHRLISTDRRGLVFATVHKFKGAGQLTDRDNVVVLVDEAHRTQEGDLGMTMRAALPNATLIGFTGTPIAKLDRNTFETFGDETDERRTLHTYDSDQSIADGMTVPIHVSPRLVTFHLDSDALDAAVAELVDAEGLTEEEAEALTRRVSRTSTFFSNPERISAVVTDLVEHFYATVDPLGMKAQIVVYDREACSTYYDELVRQLAEAGHQDEATVVISSAGSKEDDETLTRFKRSEADEEKLLRRFRTHGDPLKFLIVTAKLGTGFDAPIEGVMYLDKPLKEHTLFQTITRTNRTWRNPVTGQDKRYGIVVDYVGLGGGFARAMSPANPEQKKRQIDLDGLVDQFEAELKVAMLRFAGIDHTNVTTQTLMDAQARFNDENDQQEFAAQFQLLEGVWEAAWPHDRLRPLKPVYRFISQVYASITPIDMQASLLWHRLGAKTLELVHSHMSNINVRADKDVIVADASTIQRLIDEGMEIDLQDVADKTADEIIDSIAERLKKRLEGPTGDHHAWTSLGERLDRLREETIKDAEHSVDVMRQLFELAHDVTIAEKADDEAGAEALSLLPDPNVGALTQIFEEYVPDDAPAMIGLVVREVDSIVKQVAAEGGTDWAHTQTADRAVRLAIRKVLLKHELHRTDGLFERAYDYVRAHY
jgi:type I restriction enzyme R subunit